MIVRNWNWAGMCAILATVGGTSLPLTSVCGAPPEGVLLCGTPFLAMLDHTTRTEWLADTDIVVFAKLKRVQPPCRGCTTSYGSFEIVEVLKGTEFPAVIIGGRLDNLPVHAGKHGDIFLLHSTAPPNWRWWNFAILTADEQQYYRELQALPQGPERYAFFFDHLEEKGLRGRDADDEFFTVSYRTLRELKPHLPRERIVERLKLSDLPERRGLYAVLLGICGTADDVPWFEAELQRADPKKWWQAIPLLVGYLSLKGESGLPFVVDSYLNYEQYGPKSGAALMALRFVAAETEAIPRAHLATVFKAMRDRKEWLGYELIGLAHCQDWSELPGALGRFEKATAEKDRPLRTSIIRYLRTCPLDEALPILQECEELDPQAAVQATNWLLPISKSSSRPVWEQELVR